jgi:hypothetical protein
MADMKVHSVTENPIFNFWRKFQLGEVDTLKICILVNAYMLSTL